MIRPTHILGHMPRLATLVVLAASALAAGSAQAQNYTSASFVKPGAGMLKYSPGTKSATFGGTVRNLPVTFTGPGGSTGPIKVNLTVTDTTKAKAVLSNGVITESLGKVTFTFTSKQGVVLFTETVARRSPPPRGPSPPC